MEKRPSHSKFMAGMKALGVFAKKSGIPTETLVAGRKQRGEGRHKFDEHYYCRHQHLRGVERNRLETWLYAQSRQSNQLNITAFFAFFQQINSRCGLFAHCGNFADCKFAQLHARVKVEWALRERKRRGAHLASLVLLMSIKPGLRGGGGGG